MNRYFVKLKWKVDGSSTPLVVWARNEHHAAWKAKEALSTHCDVEDLELEECRLSTLADEPELN